MRIRRVVKVVFGFAWILIISACATKEVIQNYTYLCDDGTIVSIQFLSTDIRSANIQLEMEGTKQVLMPVMSASGAKYSNDTLVWWGKGDTGFIEKQGVQIKSNCEAQSAY